MLRAILNRPWRQHPTKQQLYGHLPPITKTIQVRRTRHAGHCWRSRDELISDVLLWIPSHGWTKAGRPARTYKQQLWEDMGCSPEDLQSLTGLNFPSPWLPNQGWRTQSVLLFTHSWRENNWIHTFPKGINAMWNAISLVQDLNSYRRVHFVRR